MPEADSGKDKQDNRRFPKDSKDMSQFEYEINGKLYSVAVKEVSGGHARVEVNGVEYLVTIKRHSPSIVSSPGPSAAVPVRETRPVLVRQKPSIEGTDKEGLMIIAPISGVVIKVLVKPGDQVKAGDVVVVIEAMKMENNITALRDGRVKEVRVHPGSEVPEGEILIVLSES
jgi:biotin carboxyl carrier protein